MAGDGAKATGGTAGSAAWTCGAVPADKQSATTATHDDLPVKFIVTSPASSPSVAPTIMVPELARANRLTLTGTSVDPETARFGGIRRPLLLCKHDDRGQWQAK
jgi:hypothetical protein